MKVKDLIAELQLYDEDLEIIIYACGNGAQEIRKVMYNLDNTNGDCLSIEGDDEYVY